MALGTGQISMGDINVELNYANNRANTSLASLHTSDGATYNHTINTANASADRPDGSVPHSMSEFHSYDHDAGVSWSISGNTGLHCQGDAGATDMATNFATAVLSGGSGGVDIDNFSTSGGPFGSLRVHFTTDGSTPSTSNSGTSSISQFNTAMANFNSGTIKIRPGWTHEPSNKDGSGSFTFTLESGGGDTSAITGNINFGF